MGIQSFIPDVLHVFHLGAYQRSFGSIIKYLTHHKLPGSIDENIEVVWSEIKAAYEALFQAS